MIPPKRSWTQSASKALKEFCGMFFDFAEDETELQNDGEEKKASKKKKRKNKKKRKF